MERKIFNTSFKSRVKFDLEFNNHHLWLRSIYNGYYYYFVGDITFYGNINYLNNHLNCYIAPTCAI